MVERLSFEYLKMLFLAGNDKKNRANAMNKSKIDKSMKCNTNRFSQRKKTIKYDVKKNKSLL